MKQNLNALINETSPYLLQHAYNPVNWLPWNDESLEKAKNENKMILVSIGYSACHWCHVMEHESFEDEYVAKLMNQHFVCIKVDREEHPDVDQFFMGAVQLLSGRGGWPLNCFALPDGRPVWGGTYFRKEQWISVLQQLQELFQNQKGDLEEQARQLTEGIRQNQFAAKIDVKETNLAAAFKKAANALINQLDDKQGGTLGAPKFPMPDLLMLQFELSAQTSDKALENHALFTLEKMARGGIYDQIGGGFARYSVDARWHVPHFEKMLYDNAQLIGLYTEAWRKTQNPFFREIVEQTIDFCLRELHDTEGGFLSALDADSEKVEGKFYVWTSEEFDIVLAEEAPLLRKYFQIDQQALWEDGNNVLVRPEKDEVFASQNGLDLEAWMQKLSDSRKKLFDFRKQRIRPATDDKRLLSWNALMIKALARAAVVFERKDWLQTAIKANDFIQQNMRTAEGGYYRSWKDEKAKIDGFLDDYAFLAQALLQLYYATAEVRFAAEAEAILIFVFKSFYDESQQSFAYTSSKSRKLAVITFENHDNVIPSSNAAMAQLLISLGLIFEKQDYLYLAGQMLHQQHAAIQQFPTAHSHWLQALMRLEQQTMIVVKGTESLSSSLMLQQKLSSSIPVLASLEKGIPVVDDKPAKDRTSFYLCDKLGCRPAIASVDELLHELKDI